MKRHIKNSVVVVALIVAVIGLSGWLLGPDTFAPLMTKAEVGPRSPNPDSHPTTHRDIVRPEELDEMEVAMEGETPDQFRLRLIAQIKSERPGSKSSWVVRSRAIVTLGSVGHKQEWLKDLLLPLVKPEEKDVSVRIKAFETLANSWRKEEWVKDMLIPLVGPDEKQVGVRIQAMHCLCNIWGKDKVEWLKNLLIPLIGPNEQDTTLRCQAMFHLGTIWGKEDWLKDLLIPVVGPDEKDQGTRQQAISIISNVWGREEWVKKLFMDVAGPKEKNDDISFRARDYLKTYYPEIPLE